jgi:HEAT repeat protein
MRRLSIIMLCLALAGAACSPHPSTRELSPTAAKVKTEAWLDGLQRAPTTAEGDVASLIQIAQDAEAPLERRSKAISALKGVGGAEVDAALETTVADGASPSTLRLESAAALAARQGSEAIPSVSRLLSDKEPKVRQAAADVLGNVGGRRARVALEGQLARESDVDTREILQRNLTKSHYR